jgi:O-antigen/teichoic acid export membrane protein
MIRLLVPVFSALVRFMRSPAALVLLGRGIQFFSQFAVVFILPKALAPVAYAQLNLLLPLAALGVTLVFGWLTGAINRHVYELLIREGINIRQTVFFYYGSISLVLLVSFFVISIFSNTAYRVVPLLLMATGLREAILGVLNMSGNHRSFLLANCGFALSLAVFVGLCVFTPDDDLAIYLTIYAALDATLAVVIWHLIGVFTFRDRPRFDPEVAARYFRYGWPLVARGLPLWVMAVSDRYLLALWRPTEAVAGYILSYQLGGSVIMIPLSFAMTIIFPRIIRVDKEEGQEAALSYTYELLRKYLRFAIVIAAGASGLVLAITHFVYPEYHVLPEVIIIIVVAHVIQGLTHFYNKEFELNGRTLVITKATVAGAIVNFGLNTVLIPSIGRLGAAISTLAAYAVTVYLVYRAREYHPKSV